jgi:acyl-coenzyme A synthetase/AMP-(fatty) acid ligase
MKQQSILKSSLLGSLQKHAVLLAVQDQHQTLSYSDLHAYILNFVELYEQAGLRKKDRILIVGEKSCEMLAAILACILGDFIYIPIESPMPEARLDAIAFDTQANARLNVGSALIKLSGTSLDIDDVLIFYTSGSTGKPKGVRIHETNIMDFVNWSKQQFTIQTQDKFCAFAPWHFDLSIFDIFVALLSGASIHCVPATTKTFPGQMTEWLRKNEISIIYMVPTAIAHLLKHGQLSQQSTPLLSRILFAGEMYPLVELRQLREHFPDTTIANLYGPTETNVCTWFNVPASEKLTELTYLPIGHSLPTFSLFVFDYNDKILTQEGDEGELICVGDAVSPGYVNDVSSAAFFIYQNQQAYRTGDLVRITNDGLVFLGRKDRQAKLYGYRIDPHEIEGLLRQYPKVKDAGVCIISQKLVAFISRSNAISSEELSQFCRKKLPGYLCPTQFIFLESLPRTNSDKLDYQKLINEVF